MFFVYTLKMENKNYIKNVISLSLNFLILPYLNFNFLLYFILWTNFFFKKNRAPNQYVHRAIVHLLYKHTEVTKYNLDSHTGITANVKTFCPSEELRCHLSTRVLQLPEGLPSRHSLSGDQNVTIQFQNLNTVHVSSLNWFTPIGIYRRHLQLLFSFKHC